jgi:predicted transcriptional regulator
MGPEMRQAILTALASSTSNTDRIRTTLYLIASSMQYQVEH